MYPAHEQRHYRTDGPDRLEGHERRGRRLSCDTAEAVARASNPVLTRLHALALPIGWAKENRPTGWAVHKAFGIIVTAFALMLGAPLSFDTLSKLARLRSAGNPEGTAKKNGTSTT